ncbi:unnamed protein product [Calicophoron daubneyi]|uniref:26S proteasome non-ATPase regulatory subunit 5 n=1 Tax=Calicophoron daubneyi TaxID=300641 RepID=A0AAV2TK72_CALDB
MQPPDDLLHQIEKVSSEGGGPEQYQCIAATLSGMPNDELKEVLRKCDIVKFFTSMDLSHHEVMEVALRLADTLFSVVPLVELIRSHQPELLRALSSNKTELVEFVLNKLVDGAREAKHDISCLTDEVLFAVVSLTTHEDLGVSKAALKFLSCVATEIKGGANKLFSPSTISHMFSTCTRAEHYLRVSEMAVAIAVRHPEYFGIITGSGILQPILDGLLNNDPLSNLNYLQVAQMLSQISGGYEWLESKGAIDALLLRLDKLKNDSFGTLLLPGYLAFFGALARQRPSYWLSGPDAKVLSAFAEAVINENPVVSMAVLESVSRISGSIDGMRVLKNHLAPSGVLHMVLRKLGRLMRDAPTEMIVRATDCVSELVKQPEKLTNQLVMVEQSEIALEWAARIAQETREEEDATFSVDSTKRFAARILKRLTLLASSPFTDTRLAALRAIQSIATQPWGVQLLVNQPGCMEYLLNRSTETGLAETPQLMQAKHDIIQCILNTTDAYSGCENQDFAVRLHPEQMACLRVYVAEGVWGRPKAQATVAMEPG